MVLAPVAPPQKPSLAWRAGSVMVMGLTGLVSKGFLYGFNDVEVIGLQRFLDLLESRRDVRKRQRGLITVSNHISILDDPVIWGVLPLRYAFDPTSLRWSLAAHDICFKNGLLARFFNLGQTLPTYRFRHSPLGGLFQPTMDDAVRLLSDGQTAPLAATAASSRWSTVTPSTYRPWAPPHAWVHVFPEACVHQQALRGLRYFKWGVARLVLETPGPTAPDVVPMFVDGTDRIMPEDRAFPRFLPRVRKRVRVVFGEPLDPEAAFGDLRRRWRALVLASSSSSPTTSAPAAAAAASSAPYLSPCASLSSVSAVVGGGGDGGGSRYVDEEKKQHVGPPPPPDVVDLEHGEEARAIRAEVTRRLRDEVLKLRRSLGYPDEEDPRLGLAETWAREPGVGYTYRSKVDDSVVKQK